MNYYSSVSYSPILYLHIPVACFNRTIVRDTPPPPQKQTNKQFSQIDFQSFKYFLNKFVSNSWLIVHANQPDTLLDSWKTAWTCTSHPDIPHSHAPADQSPPTSTHLSPGWSIQYQTRARLWWQTAALEKVKVTVVTGKLHVFVPSLQSYTGD